MPHVIILNGVSSVGKSSTAKALQTLTREPFLHVATDAFLDMLPAHMFGNPEGYVFETIDDNGHPAVVIHTGPVLARLMRGMRRSVAAMAETGANLVVDEVLLDPGDAADYRRLLREHDLRFVALKAPLEVAEARERERGDRAIGLARWQHDRVHRGLVYDLELDAATVTPEANARRICEAFDL